jgi:hypothetical protein
LSSNEVVMPDRIASTFSAGSPQALAARSCALVAFAVW